MERRDDGGVGVCQWAEGEGESREGGGGTAEEGGDEGRGITIVVEVEATEMEGKS